MASHKVNAVVSNRAYLLRPLFVAFLISVLFPAGVNPVAEYAVPYLLGYWFFPVYFIVFFVVSALLSPAIVHARIRPPAPRTETIRAASTLKKIAVNIFWIVCVLATPLFAKRGFAAENVLFLLFLTCRRDAYLFGAGWCLPGAAYGSRAETFFSKTVPAIFWPLFFTLIVYMHRSNPDIMGDALLTAAMYFFFWFALEMCYESESGTGLTGGLLFAVVPMSYLVTRNLFYPFGVGLVVAAVLWRRLVAGGGRETELQSSNLNWYSQFLIRPFVFFVIVTGLVVNSGYFKLAVEAGVICATVWLFVRDRIGALNHGFAGGVFIGALPSLIVMLFCFFISVHGPAEYILFALFAAGVVSMIRRETKERGMGGLRLRELAVIASAAGVLCGAGLAAGGWATYAGRSALRPVCGKLNITKIYDIRLVPGSNKLLFTSKEKPYVGKIDLATCRIEAAGGGATRRPERMSVFERENHFFVGGPEGTFEFSLSPLSYKGRISQVKNSDNANIGGGSLGVIYEQKAYVTIYKIAKHGASVAIPLGGSSWPYALLYEPSRKLLYVSNWNMSPNVYKINPAGRAAQRKFVGYMNAGMCALPGEGALLVARPAHGRIDALDLDTMEKRGSIAAPFGVREIECDESQGLLFAGSFFTGKVDAIDLKTKKSVSVLVPGGRVRALAYDRKESKLFIGSNSGIHSYAIRR